MPASKANIVDHEGENFTARVYFSTRRDRISDAEWAQLELDIIDFLNSDSSADETDYGDAASKYDSTSSYDGDNEQSPGNDSYDGGTDGSSQMQDATEEFVQDAIVISVLEHALGRRWSLDDSIRIFTRMNQEFEDSRGGDSWSDQEFGDVVRRAFPQDIENPNVVPQWAGEEEDDVLCIQEIDDFLLFWNGNLEFLRRSDLETESPVTGGDLSTSEETMWKYLKTRSCDEGIIMGGMQVGDGEPEMCTVCQDQLYQERETIAELECGHEYHVSCIKGWLQEKNLCPLCKAEALRPVE